MDSSSGSWLRRSVLIVQYFEFPYGDRVLLLLPLGRINFNSSDANGGIRGGKGHGELQSSLTNHSLPSLQKPEEGSVSKQNVSLGNMIDINHTDEEDNTVRTFGVVPENAMNASHIAPAPNEDGNASTKNVSLSVVVAPEPVLSMDHNSSALESGENATIAPSLNVSSAAPPESVTPRTVNIDVVAPVVAKSPSVPENGTSRNENNKSLNHSGENAPIATSLDVSSAAPPESVTPKTDDVDVGAPVVAKSPPETENGTSRKENGSLNHSGSPSDEHSSVKNSTPPTEQHHLSPENPPLPSVVSISDMNAMLLHSRATSFSESPLWPSVADQELLDARFQIEHGAVINSHPNLYAPIYRNLATFVRSYEIMEQKLKIYIYKDGKGPVFDNPRLRGIYTSEGWFMKHLEASSQLVTSNPGEAHLFYFPFSSQLLVDYVYVKDSRSFDDIDMFLKNYVEAIKAEHPFWNRTDWADHFVVACHDWAPHETRDLMAYCIRALFNSDIQEGFNFSHICLAMDADHEYEIVKKLQERKHICGMTGDGVNDASAPKKADIGIAVDDATDAARGYSLD